MALALSSATAIWMPTSMQAAAVLPPSIIPRSPGVSRGEWQKPGAGCCPSLADRHRLRCLRLVLACPRLQPHRPLRQARPHGQAPARPVSQGWAAACPRFLPLPIRTTLGRRVAHRTGRHKNNGLEQDHRGIRGRIRCMRGFKSFASAERFCRTHDELRDFLRPRTRHNQHVPADRRRLLHLRRATTVLAILGAA